MDDDAEELAPTVPHEIGVGRRIDRQVKRLEPGRALLGVRGVVLRQGVGPAGPDVGQRQGGRPAGIAVGQGLDEARVLRGLAFVLVAVCLVTVLLEPDQSTAERGEGFGDLTTGYGRARDHGRPVERAGKQVQLDR
ncbi:hypothetical protein SAMN05216215_1006234 [Saccharopolyspora shandongensis]|uniref:Uncharacterized protein n=1 Tax=Saccharopolyspora shandongensis TaxID=418495 RepID=A0A1H2XZ99_9PSEU|nr:hypothetical protein SAMN05216215_1006234 [Saccharopolyspora shandongensis]